MVINGIDRIDAFAPLFQGKRLGMVSAASAVDRDLRPSYLAFHKRFPLRCIFTPEHGLLGRSGNWEQVREAPVEPQTGAAVVSLFGGWTALPIPEQWLAQLDAVVYDIQDLGLRFYTYIATMLRVMESCAGAGVELIILDRPAVLGGEILEGCLPDAGADSIVCPYSLPVRYGLTVGELARMVNEERRLGCRLNVVPCEGWSRAQLFPDFGTPWVPPSGAIRDFETALLYSGMCLFEGTNLSEGRGTGQPFRLVGAPFVDGEALCRELEALDLPGVAFRPEVFRPASSKFRDQCCGGVSLRVTDPAAFRGLHTAVSILCRLLALYPEQVRFTPAPWSEEPFLRFLGGRTPEALPWDWSGDCEEFRRRKTNYHIYP